MTWGTRWLRVTSGLPGGGRWRAFSVWLIWGTVPNKSVPLAMRLGHIRMCCICRKTMCGAEMRTSRMGFVPFVLFPYHSRRKTPESFIKPLFLIIILRNLRPPHQNKTALGSPRHSSRCRSTSPTGRHPQDSTGGGSSKAQRDV